MASVPLTDKPVYVSPILVLLRFSNGVDGETYYVWKDGELFAQTTDTFIYIPIEYGEQPQIDIFDDSADTPVYFGERVLIQLDVAGGVEGFYVEEEVDSVWTRRQTLIVSSETVVEWRSRVLENGTTHRFRAIPYDDVGNEGEERVFEFDMVRRPDHESGTAVLASGGHIEIDIDA